MKDAGDRVMVGFGAPTDPKTRLFFQVLTFRDGKIIRIKDYDSRRKALRVAGLRD